MAFDALVLGEEPMQSTVCTPVTPTLAVLPQNMYAKKLNRRLAECGTIRRTHTQPREKKERRQMTKRVHVGMALMICLTFLCLSPPAFAELAVGTVIDKTNAEQAQGLIPDAV